MSAIPGIPSDLIDITTADALEEKKKLLKHLGRFDMLFFLVCTLVGLDTIGAAASNGAQAFTWLLFLAVLFFLPYALTVAELGAGFPEQGGPYVWCRMTFGRLVASVVALLYWMSNPIWVGGSLGILALAAFEKFFTDGQPLGGPTILGTATLGEVLFVFGFIWFTVASVVLSTKVGKWVPTIGAWVRLIVLCFFTLSVVLYAGKHGVHGGHGGSFLPSYVSFIALVPILLFNFVGFELPSSAGEEMKDPQKDVPYTVFRAGVGTVLLYGLPILAILLVLPTNQVTSLGGFLDAIKAVFTVYGGTVAASGSATLTGVGALLGGVTAVAFIFALVSSGSTWIMGADRAESIAALDGAGPRWLGYISPRFGTPVRVNIMTGIFSTVVMVLAFSLAGGNADKYFAAVLGLTISTTMISYIGIFPALAKLRYSHPDVARPYRVPGGKAGAVLVSALTTFWVLLASVSLVWPGFGVGWFGTAGNPDDSLPAGFARAQFEVSQIGPLVVLAVMGALFYAAGAKTRRHEVAIPFSQELAHDAATPMEESTEHYEDDGQAEASGAGDLR
jgi:amino acid transporter